MQIDIRCLECGKGTQNFELGAIYYQMNDAPGTLITKDKIICPKCKTDISNEKFLIKENELFMRLIAANLSLINNAKHGTGIPKHLANAFLLPKEKYDLLSRQTCGKPKFK